MQDNDPSGATEVANPDDPLMSVEWSVNLTEEETVTMQAHELAWEFISGKLDPEEVFVWRDGMDDWVAVGESEDVKALVAAYQSGQTEARGVPDQTTRKKTQAELEEELGSTVMMDMTAHRAAEASHAQPPPAAPFEDEHPLAGTVVMTGSEPSRPSPPRRLGERDEASSLFSVSKLKAQVAPKPAPRDPRAELANIGTGGGIAASFAPPPPRPSAGPPPRPSPPRPPAPRPPTPPAHLAAPHLGGTPHPSAAHPSAAHPSAPAHPPTPHPPTPHPSAPIHPSGPPVGVAAANAAPVSAHPAVLAAQLPPKPKPPIGLIMGAVASLLLVVGAVATFFVLRGGPESVAQTETTSAANASSPTPTPIPSSAPEPEPAAAADTATGQGGAEPSGDEGEGGSTSAATDNPSPKGAAGPSPKNTSASDPKPKGEPKPKPKPKAEFNRDAARSALSGAAGRASGCKKKGGPTGRGRVTVTFSPSGRATQASVGPPFGGTSVGSCAAAAFRSATVPPFKGGSVTVSKSFFIK